MYLSAHAVVVSDQNVGFPRTGETAGVLAGHLAEVSVRLVNVHSIEIGPVEYVEEFEAELEIDPLGDGRVFEQRGVPLVKAGLAETVVGLIPFHTKSGGRGKGTGREKTVQVALASGGIMVAITSGKSKSSPSAL